MKRLADIAIDQDGEELVFRVKLARSLRSILASLLTVEEPAARPEPIVTADEFATLMGGEKPSATTRPTTRPPTKTPPATARANLDREIAAAYSSPDAPAISDCAARFGVGKQRVLDALERTNTPTRPKGRAPGVKVEEMRAKREVKRAAIGPKAKPLAVPATAPRVGYEAPPAPTGKAASKDAYRKSMARHFRTPALNLTPAEQQKLLDEHFEKGGAITVVPPAPADHALKFGAHAGAGIGGGNGRKRGAS